MPGAAPASRIEGFEVVAPAGTLRAAPLEVATAWLPGELVGIRLVIPDGHSGLTGIAFALAHQPVIPRTQGAFYIGNDEDIPLETVGYPNSGAWSCFVFNTDAIDHTFYVQYLVSDFPFAEAAAAVTPVPTPAIA